MIDPVVSSTFGIDPMQVFNKPLGNEAGSDLRTDKGKAPIARTNRKTKP